ncbi:hypothetical protein GCM10017690_10730 [Microbacterium terregens]
MTPAARLSLHAGRRDRSRLRNPRHPQPQGPPQPRPLGCHNTLGDATVRDCGTQGTRNPKGTRNPGRSAVTTRRATRPFATAEPKGPATPAARLSQHAGRRDSLRQGT